RPRTTRVRHEIVSIGVTKKKAVRTRRHFPNHAEVRATHVPCRSGVVRTGKPFLCLGPSGYPRNAGYPSDKKAPTVVYLQGQLVRYIPVVIMGGKHQPERRGVAGLDGVSKCIVIAKLRPAY